MPSTVVGFQHRIWKARKHQQKELMRSELDTSVPANKGYLPECAKHSHAISEAS